MNAIQVWFIKWKLECNFHVLERGALLELSPLVFRE